VNTFNEILLLLKETTRHDQPTYHWDLPSGPALAGQDNYSRVLSILESETGLIPSRISTHPIDNHEDRLLTYYYKANSNLPLLTHESIKGHCWISLDHTTLITFDFNFSPTAIRTLTSLRHKLIR